MEHAGTDPRRVKILVGFILIFENREERMASAACTRTLSGDRFSDLRQMHVKERIHGKNFGIEQSPRHDCDPRKL